MGIKKSHLLILLIYISLSYQYFEVILDRNQSPLNIDLTHIIKENPNFKCKNENFQGLSTKISPLLCTHNDLTFNMQVLVGIPYEKSNTPITMSLNIGQPWTWVKSRECNQCQSSNFSIYNSDDKNKNYNNNMYNDDIDIKNDDDDNHGYINHKNDLCFQSESVQNCEGEKIIVTQGQKQAGGPEGIMGGDSSAVKGLFVQEHMSFLGYDPEMSQSFLQVIQDELDSEQRLMNHEEIIQLKELNIIVAEQTLGYNYFNADGAIGLGPKDNDRSYNQIQNSNFLQALKMTQSDKVMSEAIFGIFINNKGKNIKEHIVTFGGINRDLAFQKDISRIKWVEMSKKQNLHYYWNLDVQYLKLEFSAFELVQTHDNLVSNKIQLQDVPTILSINSSFISLPFKYVKELVRIMSAFGETDCSIVDKDVNLIYCRKFSIQHELSWEFEFGIKGVEDDMVHVISLNAQNLIRECNSNQSNDHASDRYDCSFNINVSKDDNIVLGEPFMKQHYMIFDQDSRKIGILKANDDQNWGINGRLKFDGFFKIMAYFLLTSFLVILVLAVCVVPLKYGIRNIKQFVFTLKHDASRQEVSSLTQSHNDEESPYAEVEAAMREQAMKEIELMEKNLDKDKHNDFNDFDNKFSMNNGQDNSFQDTTIDAFDLDFSRNKNKQYDSLDQESGF